MSPKGFSFWTNWMLLCSLSSVMLGLFFVLGSDTSAMRWWNSQIDPAFWQDATMPEAARKQLDWVAAVLGSTVASWGLLMAMIVHVPFRRRERWARTAITASLALWWPLDTAMSLYHGVSANAILNVLVLASFLPPLAVTWRQFKP